jgi:hypothetical protein
VRSARVTVSEDGMSAWPDNGDWNFVRAERPLAKGTLSPLRGRFLLSSSSSQKRLAGAGVRQRFCVQITKLSSISICPTFQLGLCPWRESSKMVVGMLKGERCFYPGRWWGISVHWKVFADKQEVTVKDLPFYADSRTDPRVGDAIGFELSADGQLQLYRNGDAIGPLMQLPIKEEAPQYFGACLSGADLTVKLVPGRLMS